GLWVWEGVTVFSGAYSAHCCLHVFADSGGADLKGYDIISQVDGASVSVLKEQGTRDWGSASIKCWGSDGRGSDGSDNRYSSRITIRKNRTYRHSEYDKRKCGREANCFNPNQKWKLDRCIYNL